MWLQETPTVVFTDVSGNSFNVRDMKVLPTYQNTKDFPISSGQLLDEIATDVKNYGRGREDSSYLIFEANAVALAENGYRLENIKTVRVPVV